MHGCFAPAGKGEVGNRRLLWPGIPILFSAFLSPHNPAPVSLIPDVLTAQTRKMTATPRRSVESKTALQRSGMRGIVKELAAGQKKAA